MVAACFEEINSIKAQCYYELNGRHFLFKHGWWKPPNSTSFWGSSNGFYVTTSFLSNIMGLHRHQVEDREEPRERGLAGKDFMGGCVTWNKRAVCIQRSIPGRGRSTFCFNELGVFPPRSVFIDESFNCNSSIFLLYLGKSLMSR